MLHQINGLHHVTSLASSASENSTFFSEGLGLRRIKATVNFDNPEVYHLYYGDTVGNAGSVLTYFPFPNIARGRRGAGEVGTTAFSIPMGSIPFWRERLHAIGAGHATPTNRFGEQRLEFYGPDGDHFALVEAADDRTPWTTDDIPAEPAIRGFHSADMRVNAAAPMIELLTFMGYSVSATEGAVTRLTVANGNAANKIDLIELPNAEKSKEGAGSVHHIAFSVTTKADQLAVQSALTDAGYRVTDVRDRNYFHAIYFRTPAGVLFEVATDEPGFTSDEDVASLGTALKLPEQHEKRRSRLQQTLEPLKNLQH
jgi:glyoxalase family protein